MAGDPLPPNENDGNSGRPFEHIFYAIGDLPGLLRSLSFSTFGSALNRNSDCMGNVAGDPSATHARRQTCLIRGWWLDLASFADNETLSGLSGTSLATSMRDDVSRKLSFSPISDDTPKSLVSRSGFAKSLTRVKGVELVVVRESGVKSSGVCSAAEDNKRSCCNQMLLLKSLKQNLVTSELQDSVNKMML